VAPEQKRGDRRFDATADTWSWGKMMLSLLLEQEEERGRGRGRRETLEAGSSVWCPGAEELWKTGIKELWSKEADDKVVDEVIKTLSGSV
jgi:hypothetical protein